MSSNQSPFFFFSQSRHAFSQLVANAAPLAEVRARALDGPRWRGLDTRAALTIGTVAAVLGVVLGCILLPQRDLLVQARDALCAGDRDFVYTLDGLGSIAWTCE